MICEMVTLGGRECRTAATRIFTPPERPGGILLCPRHVLLLNVPAGRYLTLLEQNRRDAPAATPSGGE